MRIDFLSSYNHVQKLVRQAKPESEEIAPFEPPSEPVKVLQPIEHTGTIAPPVRADLRASLKLPDASLLLPELQPETLPQPSAPPVKEPEQSVKSPTGVQGRYVKLSDPFKGMSADERSEVVGKLVADAGEEHGIDPALSLSVIKAESNFNAVAVSSDGHASKGLMQLLDSTGKEMMSRLGKEDERYSPFDPELNVDLGVGYLKHLHQVFSSETELGGNLKSVPAANSTSLEKLAVAAYNAGEGRVAAAQQRAARAGLDPSRYEAIERYLPETTQDYVKRVINSRLHFVSQSNGSEG